MRVKRGAAVLLLFPLLALACQEENGLDLTAFQYDVVTCRQGQGEEGWLFLRDDTTWLYPQSPLSSSSLSDGQRVLIGYSPVEQIDTRAWRITLQTAVQSIVSGEITYLPAVMSKELADDPLYVTSLWCSGGFVNLRFKVLYHDVSHRLSAVAFLPQSSTDTLDVEIRHDACDDAPGYYASGYASFSLPDMPPRVVRVGINSSNLGGEKQYIFLTE
ncbi:MAG: NigD-like N-terminal domain-containing protein [Porphyromonadaceae bacterium]|nr:NigD-like N-terminal domain-containing protein [Porphyromonadaceae bacterium]